MVSYFSVMGMVQECDGGKEKTDLLNEFKNI